MKATPLLLALTTCGLCACTPSAPKNTIEGQIDGLKTGDRIVLTTGTLTQTPIPTDSVTATQDGYFSLTTSATDTYANLLLVKEGETLDVNNNPSAGLFLEGYSQLHVQGDVQQWRYLKISGGLYDLPQMKTINELVDSAKAIQKQGHILLESLQQSQGKYDKDSLKILQDSALSFIRSANEIFDQCDPMERELVKNNPDLAYSAELLHYDYKTMKDFDRYDSAFRALSPRVQASPAGKAVADYIAAVRATQVGNTAPDFALEDIDGQMLRLSDLRGQYVLLDFWGTWCGGCRASIPSLVALYDQLKDKNFEIVGIAVNEYNDSYWRKVIADEKMAWRHVNDSHSALGQEIQPAYGVMGVPTCFLIDPEGNIALKGYPWDILSQVKETVEKAYQDSGK